MAEHLFSDRNVDEIYMVSNFATLMHILGKPLKKNKDTNVFNFFSVRVNQILKTVDRHFKLINSAHQKSGSSLSCSYYNVLSITTSLSNLKNSYAF